MPKFRFSVVPLVFLALLISACGPFPWSGSTTTPIKPTPHVTVTTAVTPVPTSTPASVQSTQPLSIGATTTDALTGENLALPQTYPTLEYHPVLRSGALYGVVIPSDLRGIATIFWKNLHNPGQNLSVNLNNSRQTSVVIMFYTGETNADIILQYWDTEDDTTVLPIKSPFGQFYEEDPLISQVNWEQTICNDPYIKSGMQELFNATQRLLEALKAEKKLGGCLNPKSM